MKLIGRDLEKNLIASLLQSGKHVLLEGSVGVGKTTLALEVARSLGQKVVRVDGDGRFTEQKLVGSFDPKMAIEQGFVESSFLPGPLYQAMKNGEILLINELNRMPEMVQNVLLPAMDEGVIQLPYLGELKAKKGFAMVATQNPREFVATSSLSEALLDRLEWVSIQPMSEEQEIEIIVSSLPGKVSDELRSWVEKTVAIVNLTRSHPKIKRGASIRAAISIAQMMQVELASSAKKPGSDRFKLILKTALANRIELLTGKFSSQPYSDLMDEVIEDLFSSLSLTLKKKS
jgi:gas vesicle protein GvpN